MIMSFISFVSLLKLTFLGMSTVSFVLIIFIASGSCFSYSKVRLYSNQSEAVNTNSTDEINARSVPVISPNKHRGRFHFSRPREDAVSKSTSLIIFPRQHMSKQVQTVNQRPINTVSNPDDVISQSEGIYFSIKTTQKYHSTRLSILILTWMQTVLSAQVNNSFFYCAYFVHFLKVHVITDVTEPEANDKWIRVAKKRGKSNHGTGHMDSMQPSNNSALL